MTFSICIMLQLLRNKDTYKSNTTVNGFKDDQDIANCLAAHFCSACTPNDAIKDEAFRRRYLSKKESYPSVSDNIVITVEMLGAIIAGIADNKASGHDNLVIEHIKHAHPSLIVILAKLFSIIMLTGFVPDDFGLGVTTPIPKSTGHKSNTFADDYRGITICPIISKIFEYCLLNKMDNVATSDREVGLTRL